MDMRQIMYVIELSKNGSLNQTAQKMFLSKPNLSYAIKSLESELGFDIFDRTNTSDFWHTVSPGIILRCIPGWQKAFRKFVCKNCYYSAQ